jgi:hypothetical protein
VAHRRPRRCFIRTGEPLAPPLASDADLAADRRLTPLIKESKKVVAAGMAWRSGINRAVDDTGGRRAHARGRRQRVHRLLRWLSLGTWPWQELVSDNVNATLSGGGPIYVTILGGWGCGPGLI